MGISASFPVRRSGTGTVMDDLVVDIAEAKVKLNVTAAELATAADTQIAASGNAATIAAQAAAGLATASSTDLADKTKAINTAGKVKGKLVYNTSSDILYFALGATATSAWRPTHASSDASDVTPS